MRNFKKTFHISSFDNLIVSLFVIGYKNIGESIVVLFRDKTNEGEKVVMSMVVDSYETKELKLVNEVLKKHNVQNLDFVCWTHPHWDHSPGIDELIKKMFHNDIVIFTPKFYYPNLTSDLLRGESERADEIFSNIWKLVEKHPNIKEIWRTISANGDCFTNTYPMCISPNDDNEYKELIFHFLTPLGYRTDKYAIKGNQFSKPNELSVSFVMSIDGYDFYFGGDAENEHVMGIDTETIKNMRWIKVPHHCSNGAINIANNLGPQFDYAASTVYKSSGLPNKDVQNIYAKAGSLHMTQLEELGDYYLDYEYGIVQYDYHFKKNEAFVDITTYGNAGQYYPISSQ
ncbi:MAG: hypothetical protein IKN77_06580 [Paludibacteraceae bacterium]|nr:hypothetical protein [Paludibacteraceae bacterium]